MSTLGMIAVLGFVLALLFSLVRDFLRLLDKTVGRFQHFQQRKQPLFSFDLTTGMALMLSASLATGYVVYMVEVEGAALGEMIRTMLGAAAVGIGVVFLIRKRKRKGAE